MRVAQLMLIVMSGLALEGCTKKQAALPDASNTPEQTGADTNRAGSNDVTSSGLRAEDQSKQSAIQAGTII